MEGLLPKIAKIVVTPSPTGWSWVYTFSPEDEDKKKKRGMLLAVLSFTQEAQERETAAIGREIILRLHEEYYGETASSVLENLARSVEKIGREFSLDEQKLEIVAAVYLGGALYLAIFGGGQAWLRREEKLGQVLAGSQEKLKSASGYLKEKDLLVLGTASFFALLAEGVLRAALEAGEPEEVVEFLTPLVHGQEASPGAAALIGKMERAETEVFVPKPESPVGRLVAKIWGKIPKFSLGAAYQRRQTEGTRHKKMFLTVAVILLSLFLFSLFFGAQKRQETEKQKQLAQIYEGTRALLEQGESLITLNPAQSRDLLLQAQAKWAEAEKLKIEPQRTAALKSQIEKALARVFKEYKLEEVPLFFDLTLIAAEAKGEEFSLAGQFLAVLDRGKNRVLGIEIGRKSGEVLGGGEALEEITHLTQAEGVVYLWEKEGVAEIKVKSKKLEKGKIKKDEEWGEIDFIRAYGGNLYLLDKGKKEIWRYPATEAGFGTKQRWLGKGLLAFENVVSLAIDGSIWFLTREGKILKFTQGTPMAFGISGLAKPFSSPTVIYTDERANKIYVLDRGNQRIVVLEKSGEYQAEYVWGGIKDVSDIVVSESEGKIFLLSGSKIYEIELNPIRN